jgi:predicted outer membrane repeat protein
MKKITLLTLLFIAFTGFTLIAQTTVYVSATGAGSSDGTSVENAFGNFGTALGQITSAGDKLIIIGAITPDGANLTSKNFAFTIEGLDASSTLDGYSGTGRLFTINGASSADVTFKNLTFLNNTSALDGGGGVFFNNNAGATASFENCTFTGNSVSSNAGGGVILASNGNLNITDCVFENNTSSDKGGAIVAGNSVNVTISGSLFNGNSATKGGAIAVTGNGVDFVLNTSTFVNNSVSSNGGGAMYFGGTSANSSITNTTVFNNTVNFTSLNQSTGGGIRIEGARPFTISNSLIYGNYVSFGNETNFSDIGGPPAVELTLNHSITKNIEPSLVAVGDGGNDVFSTSITDANLTSSNLTFNPTTGKVEYDAVSYTEDSPIDFGSDGNDVGAWDSGLTLSLDKEDFLATKLSVYYNGSSKNLEVLHSIAEPISLEVYTILGAKVLSLNNVNAKQLINANHLNTGIYILVGKTSEKFFSKKFLIN